MEILTKVALRYKDIVRVVTTPVMTKDFRQAAIHQDAAGESTKKHLSTKFVDNSIAEKFRKT